MFYNMFFQLTSTVIILSCIGDLALTTAFNQKSFRPVFDTSGETRLCANDLPSTFTMVDDIVGIPQGVPDVGRCSYFCTSQLKCTSFNIRQGPPRQCEGFNFTPRNCSATSSDDCQHFEVRRFKWWVLFFSKGRMLVRFLSCLIRHRTPFGFIEPLGSVRSKKAVSFSAKRGCDCWDFLKVTWSKQLPV